MSHCFDTKLNPTLMGTATWIVIVRIADHAAIVTPLWESELDYAGAELVGIHAGLCADRAEFTVEVIKGNNGPLAR